MKSELEARKESNDVLILRKEINDLKDDKMTLENKLAVLQTTAAMVAAAGGAASHLGGAGGSNSLRASDEITGPLVSQNQSLSIKVRELENQIEELNRDRKELVTYKEELLTRVNETENEIEKQNEALQFAVLQFNVEKKALNDDIAKNKRELGVLTELKKSLLVRIVKIVINKMLDY